MERYYFPLIHEQELIINYAKGAPAHVLNLPIRVDILEEIDEARMLEAFRLTVERLPYCRCRLHEAGDGTLVQYISEMEEQIPPDVLDYTDKSDKQVEKQLSKWAGTPFGRRLTETQLYTMRLLRRGDRHTLYFCGHHSMMDIYALIYFVTYLDKVYYALTTGTELPRAGADPQGVVLTRNARLTGARGERDNLWRLEQFREEPRFTSLNGSGREFVKGTNYGRQRDLTQLMAGEIRHCFPAALTGRIYADALTRRVSPYMYYCLAARTYLSRVCHQEDVSIESVALSRATLAEKSSGLNRAQGVLFRTVIPECEVFGDALRSMEHTHREELRHMAGHGPLTLIGKAKNLPEGMLYFSVILSYVPFVDYSKIHLKIRAGKIESGVSLGPLYVLLMPIDDSGDLWATYQYAKGYYKPETIEKFHNFMLRFLQAGLDDPEATIGELTDRCL